MFIESYKKALAVLVKKPIRLWGLSLLNGFICAVATLFSFPFFLVVGIAINYVITAGMAKVYLDGLEGKQVYSDQLFEGFKTFFRTAGGMAWKDLWILIWNVAVILVTGIITAIVGWIPVLGILLTIILSIAGTVVIRMKDYSYRFVPYILMTKPEVNATEALRVSMKMTRGKRMQMFLADLVFGVIMLVVYALLIALCMIPYIGPIFIIAMAVVTLLLPIFVGLYSAAFYTMPQPSLENNPYYNNNVMNQYQNFANQNAQYVDPQGYAAPEQQYAAPEQQYAVPEQQYGYVDPNQQ